MEPIFLSLEDVMALHQDQIDTYGGSPGVRELGLLLSAIEMPKASFGGQFLHEDLHMMSAAYLFHIVQNHPFIDGNKRTGLAATIAFMQFNKLRLVANHDSLTEMVLDVAQGHLTKDEIAHFLRENSAKTD